MNIITIGIILITFIILDIINRKISNDNKLKYILTGLLYPLYFGVLLTIIIMFLPVKIINLILKGFRRSQTLEDIEFSMETYIINVLKGDYYTLNILETPLKNVKTYITLSLIELTYGMLIGYIIGILVPEKVYYGFLTTLMSLILKMNMWDSSRMFNIILKNNLRVITLISLTSALISILYSTIIFLYNGFLIGFIVSGGSVMEVIKGVLPHGVFEITGLILAGVSGLMFNKKTCEITSCKRKSKKGTIFLLLSIVFIVIAAFIESYVTPKLLGV